jgi:MFS family permease
MAFFLADGLFIGLTNALTMTYIPLYALGMGASGAEIGLLSALQNGAAIAGSAASGTAVRWLHSRKLVSLYFHRIIDHLVLLLVVAIPSVAAPSAAIYTLLGLQAIRSFLSSIGAPAWSAFVPLIVPLEVRGRYMAVRWMIKVISGIAVPPLAAFIILSLGGYPTGYQVNFALAVGTGLTCAWFFSQIPEPASVATADLPASPQAGRLRWRSPFGRFAIGVSLWTVASTIAAPFYIVFMSKSLGLGVGAIGLLTSFTTAAQLVGLIVIGRLVDRRGARVVYAMSTLALAVVPLGWLLVQNWSHIVPLAALSGLATAGSSLAGQNALWDVTPEEGRASYTSAYYTLTSIAATVAPLLGGWCFAQWGFHGVIAVGGVASVVAASLLALLLRR